MIFTEFTAINAKSSMVTGTRDSLYLVQNTFPDEVDLVKTFTTTSQ